MKKVKIVFAIAVVLVAVACKKDNKNSNMDLISSGSWKMTAFTVNPGYDYDGNGTIDTDIYSLYDACEKDDYYSFHTDGKMEVNEGPTKCDASDPQAFTVEWQFANNGKAIIIDGEQMAIDELSSSKLILDYNDYGTKTIITFTKQ